MIRRFTAPLGVIILALSAFSIAPAANAAKCPPESVGGKTIGWVEFDDVRVPIKETDYPAGGKLDPPASNKVAGMSTRHQNLRADQGTTVLAWHVRYGKKCKGTLNPLLQKKIGETFDIVTKSGQRATYQLEERTKVKRGKYKRDWFRLHGDRQIALFTCSDLRKGKFERTRVLIASPVETS